jgi:peptidoglycan/LPS O-acetylase OafA/YrhL
MSRDVSQDGAPASVRAGRLPGVDGLRALAAGSIVCYHCWLYAAPDGRRPTVGSMGTYLLSGLSLGVTLFFTLSAFLLYRPFAAAVMRDERRPSVRRYARNRVLRIFPAYWVVLALVALLGAALVRDAAEQTGTGRITDPGLLLRNAVLLQNYDPRTLITGIGPAWSLSVEVVFYAVLPLLALIAAAPARGSSSRAHRRIWALCPALVLFCVGLSGKLVGALVVAGGNGWDATWHSVIERSFWGQADLFSAGLVVAVLRVDAEDGLLRLPRWWRKAAWSALVGIGLSGAVLMAGGLVHPYAVSAIMAVPFALLLSLVVLPGGGAKRPRLVSVLEWRPMVITGIISYSLFLWNEPLIRWLAAHGLTFSGPRGLPLTIAVAGTLAWLLAGVTYACVERPALRRRSARRHRARHAADGDGPAMARDAVTRENRAQARRRQITARDRLEA